MDGSIEDDAAGKNQNLGNLSKQTSSMSNFSNAESTKA